MRYWGYLVAILYIFMLVAIILPVLNVCFELNTTAGELFTAALYSWGFWLTVGIMLTAEVVLLFVPVQVLDRRPVPQRPLRAAIWTAAVLLALISLLGITSLIVGCFGDHGAMALYYTWPILPILWIWWAFLFSKRLITAEASAGYRVLTNWLLKGSILELLIAVPCHVITRHRNDCCAPLVSSIGIATGISVMLLSFGPGVLFLYIERRRRLQPRAPTTTCCDASGDATTNADN